MLAFLPVAVCCGSAPGATTVPSTQQAGTRPSALTVDGKIIMETPTRLKAVNACVQLNSLVFSTQSDGRVIATLEYSFLNESMGKQGIFVVQLLGEDKRIVASKTEGRPGLTSPLDEHGHTTWVTIERIAFVFEGVSAQDISDYHIEVSTKEQGRKPRDRS